MVALTDEINHGSSKAVSPSPPQKKKPSLLLLIPPRTIPSIPQPNPSHRLLRSASTPTPRGVNLQRRSKQHAQRAARSLSSPLPPQPNHLMHLVSSSRTLARSLTHVHTRCTRPTTTGDAGPHFQPFCAINHLGNNHPVPSHRIAPHRKSSRLPESGSSIILPAAKPCLSVCLSDKQSPLTVEPTRADPSPTDNASCVPTSCSVVPISCTSSAFAVRTKNKECRSPCVLQTCLTPVSRLRLPEHAHTAHVRTYSMCCSHTCNTARGTQRRT